MTRGHPGMEAKADVESSEVINFLVILMAKTYPRK